MRVGIFLGICLMGLGLTGCGQKVAEAPSEVQSNVQAEQAESVQEIKMCMHKLPETLDPQLNVEREGAFAITHMYEGLMRQVGEEVINGIAESYTVSEDGLTYTFTLRDALWSDGEEVTATDFLEGWRQGVNPLNEGKYLKVFESSKIKNAGAIVRGEMSVNALGVLALDSKTLEVTLEEANPEFLEYLALECFLPYREDNVSNTVYNGPFTLSNQSETGFTLVKNANYWNATEVHLDNIAVEVIEDESVANEKYLKDEIQILIGELAPLEDTDNLETTGSILVHSRVEGWRLNYQDVLWLGNAYTTKQPSH